MAFQPGETVEHFVIVSLLGEGGMGQVYEACDTRLQRNVALKIVQPAATESDVEGSNGAARLLREAQSAAGLEHPNVVTIYEVGKLRTPSDDTGRPFIAMELVRGRPLRAFIGDQSIAIGRRVAWLVDIARALEAAHRAKLVHRDIKPENVMVREDGAIKVLDFGLAKRAVTPSTSMTSTTEGQALPSLTAKGIAIGTPYYMAPEQMRREPLDGRADQFAWAVVAYELLSGEPPWGRDVDPLELVSKLLSGEPPPLEEVCHDVPPHVVSVVKRALSKRRHDRFDSMAQIIVALDDASGAFAATLPVGAVPPPPLHERRPSSTPSPLRVAVELDGPDLSPQPRGRRAIRAIAVGGALLAVVAGLGWRLAREKPALVPTTTASPPPECTRHTECISKNGNRPAVCNSSGRCASIETEDCKALVEPSELAREDTVWIGAMFPLNGESASFGVSNLNAVDLGRRDFAQSSDSLRLRDGTVPVHALAVVACDDQANPRRAAEHLVQDIGVPAVIGFGSGRTTTELASSLFVPHDVLTVASITLSPLLAGIPHEPGQPRLVWRTTYNNANTARALAAMVGRLERQLRNTAVLGVEDTMRVAVVRRKDAGNVAFAQALFETLRFNQKSALDNGQAYREFAMDMIDGREDHSAAVVAITRFEPTVVIFAADSILLSQIEAAWPRDAKLRPRYLTPSILDDELLRFVGKSAERRRRLFGFTSVSTTMPNARFVLHYNETFADSITRAWAPNSSYDAFYIIAYAAYALGRKPVTGRALAESIGRLVPPGPSIDVGPSGILRAFSALRRGENIDVNGATGSLDFDLLTGEAPVDLAVICASVDASGEASGASESGLVFEAKSQLLVGEPVCP